MKKRILSMLIMLTMVFSLIVVPNATGVSAETYFDTVDTDCELAVNVVTALGIMGGYTDGSFLPYNPITRAEMASVAVRLAGLEGYPDTAPDDMQLFDDMYDYDGWASGVVAVAKAAGIAKADENGNFNPDMSATYEDAMQMIVSSLGYGHQAMSRGGKPGDYVYVAQRLGITKKLSTSLGQNITRGDVAKAVYAALTVDLMEPVSYTGSGIDVTYRSVPGVNALNSYFDVYEVKGIITDNAYAAINGETDVDDDEVLINGEVFDVGYTDIYNYLGYYATVYALNNDDSTENRRIIAYSVNSVKNNTITIKDENIESVSSTVEGYQYEYWNNKDTDKRSKVAKTSAAPMILYNGKAVIDVTASILTPENGHVVLIDNNGDDKYDIIDIWEYELVYVLTVSKTTGNVSGYYDSTKTYKLDPEHDSYDVVFLNAYGGAAQLSDINQYSVLYVYESLDGTLKKVVISNNKVTGTVEEATSDGYYTIGGTEYEVSPAAKGKLDLAVSDAGDFYLDADMRLVGFEGTTVIRKNIGMFIAVNDGGLARGYQMKVLTQNNGVQIYKIASAVKVNEKTKMTAEQIYELAFTDALFGATEDPMYKANSMSRPNPSRAGFLYKLNADNEICEIIVVGEGDGYLQTRQLKTAGQLYYSAGYKCLHYSGETTTDEFGNSAGVRTYCDEKTVNFVADEAVMNTDDNQSFFVKYMSSYWDNYNFEVYDFVWAYYYSPDEEAVDMQKTVCNFLVMADWYDDAVDSSEDSDQNTDATYHQDNTAVKFIYKITEAVDRTSGDPTYRVYYFDGTSLKNNIIRPKYKHEAFNSDTGALYTNGYPVRISFDGSYIEDIAPYFDSIYTPMQEMITPVYNNGTESNIMPFMPFYQEQWRKWNRDASYTYCTRYYCGMITSIDEIVGRKLFTLAYATSESEGETPADNTYTLDVLANEKLEGTVYRLELDRDGKLTSISRGSLDDIAPGQLVLIRRRAYDSSPKWLALTGYAMHEIYIIDDSVSELDYLEGFYKQVQAEIINR